MEYVDGPAPAYNPVPRKDALDQYEFFVNGYALLPAVPSDLLKCLQDEVQALPDKEFEHIFNNDGARQFHEKGENPDPGDGTRKQCALRQSNTIKRLFAHLHLPDHITPRDPTALQSTPGGKDQDPHADYALPERPIHIHRQPVGIIVALQEDTLFHIFPGKFCQHYQCAPPLEERVTVKMAAGTVFVFSGLLWHAGSSQNTTNRRVHIYGDSKLFPREKDATEFGEPQAGDNSIGVQSGEDWYFVGQVEHELRSGWGSRIQKSEGGCQIYDGVWHQGVQEGNGILSFGNGKYFSGTFNDGEFETGELHWDDGRVYSGQFEREAASKQDLPHGKGALTFPDGSVWIGRFDKGVGVGKGTMSWPGTKKTETRELPVNACRDDWVTPLTGIPPQRHEKMHTDAVVAVQNAMLKAHQFSTHPDRPDGFRDPGRKATPFTPSPASEFQPFPAPFDGAARMLCPQVWNQGGDLWFSTIFDSLKNTVWLLDSHPSKNFAMRKRIQAVYANLACPDNVLKVIRLPSMGYQDDDSSCGPMCLLALHRLLADPDDALRFTSADAWNWVCDEILWTDRTCTIPGSTAAATLATAVTEAVTAVSSAAGATAAAPAAAPAAATAATPTTTTTTDNDGAGSVIVVDDTGDEAVQLPGTAKGVSPQRGEWMHASAVNAVQDALLRAHQLSTDKARPEGFRDTGREINFTPVLEKLTSKFPPFPRPDPNRTAQMICPQIWNLSDSHWVATVFDSKDRTVWVLDSLPGGIITFEERIRAVYAELAPAHVRLHPRMGRQNDGSSCGPMCLLAIHRLLSDPDANLGFSSDEAWTWVCDTLVWTKNSCEIPSQQTGDDGAGAAGQKRKAGDKQVETGDKRVETGDKRGADDNGASAAGQKRKARGTGNTNDLSKSNKTSGKSAATQHGQGSSAVSSSLSGGEASTQGGNPAVATLTSDPESGHRAETESATEARRTENSRIAVSYAGAIHLGTVSSTRLTHAAQVCLEALPFTAPMPERARMAFNTPKPVPGRRAVHNCHVFLPPSAAGDGRCFHPAVVWCTGTKQCFHVPPTTLDLYYNASTKVINLLLNRNFFFVSGPDRMPFLSLLNIEPGIYLVQAIVNHPDPRTRHYFGYNACTRVLFVGPGSNVVIVEDSDRSSNKAARRLMDDVGIVSICKVLCLFSRA
eukprot:m.296103 g.296103  ORF g.296103 m.296103 type:complete len:1167 (+) comp22976_c0_seq2:236-3736(+)